MTSGRDPLNFINPEDIASMTVLRDAGAAAIYGTNAANGVVLITTKRGESGQPMKIEYTGSVSASRITRVPSMLNAQQFRAAVEQFAPASASQLQNENTDWYGAIDRTGFGQEHNVALSGGGKSMDYRASLNFLDQRGIIDANSARRFGLGLNYNQRLANDRLSLRFSVRGSRTDDRFTPLGVLSNAAQYGPTQPIDDPAAPTGFYDWPGNSSTSADNPVAILNLAEEKAETYRAIGNMQTEYRLPWVDGLRANLTLGFDASDGVRRNFLPSVLHREQATGRGGQQTRYNPQQTSTVLESYLSYTTPRPVGPGILDLTGGYSWSKTHIDSIYYEGTGLTSDAGGTDRIVRAANTTNIVFEQQSKLVSFFGRLNYNINDRYILAASLRHDGSSRFGAANDYGTFPSVSVAWRLSQESFLRGHEGAVRPQAPRLLGQDRQPVLRELPGVLLLSAGRQSDPVSVRRHRLHDQPPQRRGPGHQVGADPGGQPRPRFRVRQSADHRRDRLLRQADRRPALHRAGRGVQQPVELRHHQHRQHAELRDRAQPRRPDPGWRGPRTELAGGLHRGPQQEQPQEHHPVRRVRARAFWSAKRPAAWAPGSRS